MTFPPWVHELVGPVVSSLFDPYPIAFRQADEAGVRPVRSACRTTDGGLRSFKRPLNRNAFLCGCLDFTERETSEHLIVGFGYRQATTTKIHSLSHVAGSLGAVSFPPSVQNAIQGHVTSSYKAEVLVFHNHPAPSLDTLFDSIPVASRTDRMTLLTHLVQPMIAIKSLLGGGRIRWYLGASRYMREFRTPNLLGLLEAISRLREKQ